ncbi:hypothetical protein AFL01nite_20330 [Aeromicrobium flavum]|uniref:Uncharacterized protein n=1 Tax=Aeromicrobium flavum TaxID=416568 RepID=A0A512HW81_9ACTN|nr:hypothetical protein [Aeromicrobium flavum]GEO89706.1 hypothetical protein AFL01nite_20330 [Aeromicrobium flavum]
MGARETRQSLAFAALTGLVSVVPIGRAPRRVRIAVAATSGAVAGGAAFLALRSKDVPAPPSALAGAGLGGVAAGATALGFTVDRAFEQALVRRGVPHPRLVLGVLGAGLSYALDVLDRRFDTAD